MSAEPPPAASSSTSMAIDDGSTATPEFVHELTRHLRNGMKNKGRADFATVEPYPAQIQVNDLMWNQKKNVLNVVATSQGKTETFYFYTRLARQDPKAGPVVVFCPANALLNDQLKRAKEFGFEAVVFGNKDQAKIWGHQDEIAKKLCTSNTIDILFMTADIVNYAVEHDNHPLNLVQQFLAKYTGKRFKHWQYVPLLVVDEIHTIAEATDKYFSSWRTLWGQLENRYWFKNARKLGLTATLDSDEREVVNTYFPGAEEWSLVYGGRLRKNIVIRCIPGNHTDRTRINWCRSYVSENNAADHSILIFVNRVTDCDLYADEIRTLAPAVRGSGEIAVYHAQLTKPQRQDIEDKFRTGQIRVLVATKAIGVGFDKPDLRSVIHTFTPPTPTEYYQQIGRSGRDGNRAHAWLLPTKPWNKNTTVNALIQVVRFLYRNKSTVPKYSASKELLSIGVEALSQGQLQDSIIEQAINWGVKTNILSTGGDLIIFPHTLESLTRFNLMVSNIEVHANKLKMMNSLNRLGGDCYWRQLLQALHDPTVPDDFICGDCSGGNCDPEGDDIPPDSFAGSVHVWSLQTPNGIQVYGLRKANLQSDMSSDRLRLLASNFLPNVNVLPALWCVCYIKSTDGKVEKTAELVAHALDLEIHEIMNLNPEVVGSIRSKLTPESKLDHVTKKYQWIDEQIPPVGNVLLFDDTINTGTTMDHVANYLKDHGLNVIGLVDEVYETLKPVDVKMSEHGLQ